MYYAITIDADGRITGRHESTMALTADVFSGGAFDGQEVRAVTADKAYRAGYLMAEYDAEGALRPIIDRIKEGLAEVPQGFELVGDELVELSAPATEAPPTLMARVEAAERKAAKADLSEKATRVMFRALAANDTISEEDAMENKDMFPMWSEHIGKRAEENTYWLHGDKLYRVNTGQGHTIQADWSPDKAASLFSLAANPAEEWPEWIQPTGAHNAYAVGDKVTHDGKRWISTADNNTWMPGEYGWEEAV